MQDDEKDDLYPSLPDIKRVDDLRARLRSDKASSKAGQESGLNRKVSKSAKDIGTYTLIPSLMVAGPVVGYFLGRGIEKYIGGEPWGAVVGMLFGIVAAFRQVFLLLAKKSEK